jgi:uncharacterized protein (TIGR02145 family)
MERSRRAFWAWLTSLILFAVFSLKTQAQKVGVTEVRQEGNNLRVLYSISGGGPYTVSLHYSLDDGQTWLGPARSVSGDVGKNIGSGLNKSLVWNVLADRENLKGEALRLKVLAKTEDENTVTDIDGNTYPTVRIGIQIWMKENLKTSRYRDGSAILTGLSNEQWSETNTGAFAVYDDNPRNDKIFGKLYNWYAVADPRGLCPAGWHVPSHTEWETLEEFLGGVKVAGGKMKAVSELWNSSNVEASNQSGFSALPGGYRYANGYYSDIGYYGYWWSSTENSSAYAWTRSLSYSVGNSYRDYYLKQNGFSVRCLRDK